MGSPPEQRKRAGDHGTSVDRTRTGSRAFPVAYEYMFLTCTGQAPPSFQPPITISTSSSTPTPPKPSKPGLDLITRYNLQSKVNSKGKERADASPPSSWASSKDQRQAMLQRRREEMILAARRRMEERDEDVAGSALPLDEL